MALLAAHRRYLGPAVAAMLVLLMISALLPDPMGKLPPFPPLANIASFHRAVSNYFSDNFGYARSMPLLRGVIQYQLGSTSDPNVYIGRNGHLYYKGDHAVGQSTGGVYRRDDIERFVETADALHRALEAIGGHLIVMSPPNAQSVGKRDQPSWWHVGGPTEYDLAMNELRQRGIATIDLKAAFAAMPDEDDLYLRTGTHWRWKGGLIAFNLTMRAIGHDEWSLDPATSLSPLVPGPTAELARIIGLQDYLRDEDYGLRLPPQDAAWRPIDVIRSPPYLGLFMPFAFERDGDGERILVLGDSFTLSHWRPLLLHTGASRVGWTHHAECGFDFSDVVRFRPTYVILAPTERALPCRANAWPRGMPRVTGRAT